MNWLVRVVGTLAVCMCVAACGSRTGTGAGEGELTRALRVPVVEHDRFPHAAHTSDAPGIRGWRGRGLQCTDCHLAADVVAGKVARPGSDQHAPCDDCHKAEFEKPPGPLCRVCHASVDPMKAGDSPLKPYPGGGMVQSLASSFSHRIHLDAGRMEAAVGHHVSCGDCHARDPITKDPMLPGHKACLPCHEASAGVKAKLGMERCDGCHVKRDLEIRRGRIFITGDLQFHHATHQVDRSGAPVPCTTCHDGVAQSGSREDMAVPSMERCAQCHEDARKSPERVRMANCSVCHATIRDGTPPTDHMVSGAIPSDHTLEFRHDHAAQAAAPDANCRFCHKELSGKKEDSCFQCHEVMRPHDHDLAFRDDHGHEAEADAQRCATCHAPEYCAACHSIPPPSHTPIDDFRNGGHAQQARFDLSACLTCHTYETTCAQCHRGAR